MNEQETCTNFILPTILKAGLIDGSRIREEYPISKGCLIGNGQRSKRDKTDYILQVRYPYSTNGLQIYGIDIQKGKEGGVTAYPNPDELWQMKGELKQCPRFEVPLDPM